MGVQRLVQPDAALGRTADPDTAFRSIFADRAVLRFESFLNRSVSDRPPQLAAGNAQSGEPVSETFTQPSRLPVIPDQFL